LSEDKPQRRIETHGGKWKERGGHHEYNDVIELIFKNEDLKSEQKMDTDRGSEIRKLRHLAGASSLDVVRPQMCMENSM
jgi:hypothetical protein